MCSDGGSEVSASSEVSDATVEANEDSESELYTSGDSSDSVELTNGDSSDELCEGGDASETNKAGDELVDATNVQDGDDPDETEVQEATEESSTEDGEVDEAAVRAEINEKSNYSDEVNEHISSVEELEVYQKAGLREESVDGRTALVRDDIDWDQKDEFGRSNRKRVEEDLVPYDTNGDKIELHHIGQKDDAPFAELSQPQHRGKGNDTVLHDKQKESEIDRADYTKIRVKYWKSRVK